MGAGARAYRDQALGRQAFHRFANDEPAGAIGLGQLRLGRQLGAFGVAPGNDAGTDCVNDLVVKVAQAWWRHRLQA
ncbi:hypothetical protein D3C78_1512400 [compost metagenome]